MHTDGGSAAAKSHPGRVGAEGCMAETCARAVVTCALQGLSAGLCCSTVASHIRSYLMRPRRYDPARRMSLLVSDWVSRASTSQRRGRAGRVRPGICLSLFTRQRYERLMRQYGQPEIMRVPLEELVLQVNVLYFHACTADMCTVLRHGGSDASVRHSINIDNMSSYVPSWGTWSNVGDMFSFGPLLL